MPKRSKADSIAQARLAYITAGQPPLAGPRHAFPEAGPDQRSADPDPEIDAQVAATSATPGGAGLWARLNFTHRHAIAVLILLIAGTLVAAGVLATSRATPVTVEMTGPTPVESDPIPSEAVASVPSTIRVHVAGAVVTPGVVSIPEGSIVEDAIIAAGGFTERADPAQLNLAAPLVSGQQVLVGTRDAPLGEIRDPAGAAAAGGGDGALINLNNASAQELEELPGVGPVLAAAIVDWRESNGGFTAVADLQEVSGIGPRSYERLEPLVTV